MIIIADLHGAAYKDFSEQVDELHTTRIKELVDSLEYVMNYMLSVGDKDLIILGDVFDVKSYIRIIVYNAVWRCLRKMEEKGIRLYLLPGNHDMDNSSGSVHSLEAFKGIASVFDTVPPKSAIIDDSVHYFLPYRKPIELGSSFDYLSTVITTPNRSILFMHQTFSGFKLTEDYDVTAGVTIPDVIRNKFKYIISGDLHIEQAIGNIVYPGSLLAKNFTDTVREKSFLHYTNGEFKRIVNPCSPRFISCRLSSIDDLLHMDLQHTAKVYMYIECDSTIIEKVKNHLNDYPNVKYRIVRMRTVQRVIKRSALKLSMSSEDIIHRYVEHAGNGDVVLKDLGLDIYKEVIGKR